MSFVLLPPIGDRLGLASGGLEVRIIWVVLGSLLQECAESSGKLRDSTNSEGKEKGHLLLRDAEDETLELLKGVPQSGVGQHEVHDGREVLGVKGDHIGIRVYDELANLFRTDLDLSKQALNNIDYIERESENTMVSQWTEDREKRGVPYP